MAVGDTANILRDSYLAFGRETTFGTGVTATANLDFLSHSFKLVQESKTIQQVERSRVMTKSLRMGRVYEGELEAYFYPRVTACAWLLQNAMGGTITTATSTGETIGGGALTHTFLIGNMDQANKSLSANYRNGPSSTGQVFSGIGLRVNEWSLESELDEYLKLNMGFIGVDQTSSATDVNSLLTITSSVPLSFENGRFSVEGTFASLTSSSFWHVQSVKFKMGNNLKADNESRRIGSDVLTQLPVGVATFNLSVSIRFDTLTAYTAMVNDTSFAAEFEFLGDTMSGSAIRQGLKLQFPKVKINNAGQPEISGPDGIITSEVEFQVLGDDSSASGYALRCLLTNDMTAI